MNMTKKQFDKAMEELYQRELSGEDIIELMELRAELEREFENYIEEFVESEECDIMHIFGTENIFAEVAI